MPSQYHRRHVDTANSDSNNHDTVLFQKVVLKKPQSEYTTYAEQGKKLVRRRQGTGGDSRLLSVVVGIALGRSSTT